MGFHYNIQPGTVQSGPTGPIIFREGITIPLEANVQEFKLEEKSDVENHILAGIWATKAGTPLRLGRTVAAQNVIDSAYLVLRTNATVVMDELYIDHILKANAEGRPFLISLPGPITMSRSTLVVQAPGLIQANTAIQIQVDYLKK